MIISLLLFIRESSIESKAHSPQPLFTLIVFLQYYYPKFTITSGLTSLLGSGLNHPMKKKTFF